MEQRRKILTIDHAERMSLLSVQTQSPWAKNIPTGRPTLLENNGDKRKEL